MIYTVVNIDFYWNLLQKPLLVIVISRFKGLKLGKILQICLSSFVKFHLDWLICWLTYYPTIFDKVLPRSLACVRPKRKKKKMRTIRNALEGMANKIYAKRIWISKFLLCSYFVEKKPLALLRLLVNYWNKKTCDTNK